MCVEKSPFITWILFDLIIFFSLATPSTTVHHPCCQFLAYENVLQTKV